MYTSVFAKINFRPHRDLRRSPALRDNSAEVFILRSLLTPSAQITLQSIMSRGIDITQSKVFINVDAAAVSQSPP